MAKINNPQIQVPVDDLPFTPTLDPNEFLWKCKLNSMVAPEIDPISEMFVETIVDSASNDVRVCSSDVSLIFNNNRLATIGQFGTQSLMDRFRERTNDIFKGFSDEEIMSVIKSKYVQHSSEIDSWVENLIDKQDSLLATLVAEQHKDETSTTAQTETDSTEPATASVSE